MKSLPVKVITFVLSAFLMACGTGNAEQPKAEPTPDHVHSFSTADCENPSICTVCGLENEPALGHTVSIGMCSRCGQLVNAEHLEKFRTDMVKVTEVGAKIPQFFLNVDGKGAAEHYSAFTACDPVIDEFNKALETVLDDCEGYDELNFMDEINPEFQTTLKLKVTRDGVLNGLKITTYTKLNENIIAGPLPMLNPPLLIPLDEMKVKVNDFIEVELKYIMGNGIESIGTKIL